MAALEEIPSGEKAFVNLGMTFDVVPRKVTLYLVGTEKTRCRVFCPGNIRQCR